MFCLPDMGVSGVERGIGSKPVSGTRIHEPEKQPFKPPARLGYDNLRKPEF
jgi:hypothetical protein